jgi:DNA-binding FadR family transcriptional regulator
MNRLAFLEGYLTKTAVDSVLDQMTLPASAEEAEAMATAAKVAEKEDKKKIRKDLMEMEVALAKIKAQKKQKELALYST